MSIQRRTYPFLGALCLASYLPAAALAGDGELIQSDPGTSTITKTTTTGDIGSGLILGAMETEIGSGNLDINNGNEAFKDISISYFGAADEDGTTDPVDPTNPDGTLRGSASSPAGVFIGSFNDEINQVSVNDMEATVSGNSQSFSQSSSGGGQDCSTNGLVLGAACSTVKNDNGSGNGGDNSFATGDVIYGTYSHQYISGISNFNANTGLNNGNNSGVNFNTSAVIYW